MILFAVQCRMARAALELGVRELASAAKERTVEALQRTLEAAGIEFTDGDRPGVRLSRFEALGLFTASKPRVSSCV